MSKEYSRTFYVPVEIEAPIEMTQGACFSDCLCERCPLSEEVSYGDDTLIRCKIEGECTDLVGKPEYCPLRDIHGTIEDSQDIDLQVTWVEQGDNLVATFTYFTVTVNTTDSTWSITNSCGDHLLGEVKAEGRAYCVEGAKRTAVEKLSCMIKSVFNSHGLLLIDFIEYRGEGFDVFESVAESIGKCVVVKPESDRLQEWAPGSSW